MKKTIFFVLGMLFFLFTFSLYAEIGENIESYGANGTDAVDDHDAIMSAINAAMASGSKVVIIPEGDFYLDSPIVLTGSTYNQLTIKGIGRASNLIHRGGTYAFQLGNGTALGAAGYLTLRDFKISNDPSNTNASAGIYVYFSNRNLYQNLWITGYDSNTSGANNEGGACIKFQYSWIHTVRECYFYDSNHGIYLCSGSDTANNLNIVDCLFECLWETGVFLSGASGVKISGCCFEGGTMEYGVFALMGKAYGIQNCYFEAISGASIYLGSSAYLLGVNITGNYIRMQDSDYAIDIYGVQGAHISGNMFSGVPNEAVIKTRAIGYVRQVWLVGNSHYPGDNITLWDGYDYIKKYDPNHLFQHGMWEDIQNSKLIYGSTYTLAQDQ